ncbi:ArsR/SmtB family transcription factor [Schleiferilactobacillus shenzhenensis]|uniref:HTH arsR-type domain-containing protein n=1 Tax=Schleiferilactobacillus shenzhenensis LY-73 TaxID=1231336 RepID=U4TVP5_9LACO|nr:metalloregulator ArsR/SmtB family transcription factor [Schleiferilactobacillus shenzhenensis]ERL65913.1 hypothetical protein L248_1989 [Schleiferilactobacillus shenzhenensis LY-73]
MVTAEYAYSHDLEIAMVAQMALSSHLTLPDDLTGKTAGLALSPTARAVLAALDQQHALALLEIISASDVAGFSIPAFAAITSRWTPAELISVMLGVPSAATADTWPAVAAILQTQEKELPVLVGQYVFDHQTTFINDLQSYLTALASRFSATDFSSADAAAKSFKGHIETRLKTNDPLALAEDLMGKQFRNRGPYQRFYFVPTFFGPTIRLFGKQQTLFIHVPTQPLDQAAIVTAWKALADETRYQLIRLLDDNGPLRAVDLADQVGFSAPTISHHLDVLYRAGLVHIEPVGRAKYYSLNRARFRQLELVMQRLSEPKPRTR